MSVHTAAVFVIRASRLHVQLRWDWTSFHVGVYQPLAWMFLGAQYVLFGLKPWGYHLTSLTLHAVNTVVLFVLTVSLLARCQSGREPENAGLLIFATGLAVALFILLQSLIDRRDPKVSRAPERGDDDTVGFS